jgi:hypothetical protein
MRTFVVGTLIASYIGMLVSAVTFRPEVFLAFAAVSYGLDLFWHRRQPAAIQLLSRAQLGITFRFLLRQTMLCVLLLGSQAGAMGAVILLVTTLLLLHGLRSFATGLLAPLERRRIYRIGWRNLDVQGLDLPAGAPGFFRTNLVRKTLHLDVPVVAAAVAVTAGAPQAALVVGSALSLLGAAVVAAIHLRQLVMLIGRPAAEEVTRRVRERVEDHAPEVVIYVSGSSAATLALNGWTPVLEALQHRCLIMVRERTHLTRASSTGLPILFLPGGADVERFRVPSMRLALYLNASGKNNHLLRLTKITDVLIGHGNGEDGLGCTPISRVYDEVWVAGQAGRDRYAVADIGVQPSQIREVGRPQLCGIKPDLAASAPQAGQPPTVLYAPAWEGPDGRRHFASHASMGPRIVELLLSAPLPARVLYLPHRAAGRHHPATGAACTAIRRMLHEAGGEHISIDPQGGRDALYDAINEADVLIGDVSPAVDAFLWSRKPYILSNPLGLPDDALLLAHPSAGAAYVLPRDCAHLHELLEEAVSQDPLRDRRHSLATYLLGAPCEDLHDRFADAVTAVAGPPREAPAEPHIGRTEASLG